MKFMMGWDWNCKYDVTMLFSMYMHLYIYMYIIMIYIDGWMGLTDACVLFFQKIHSPVYYEILFYTYTNIHIHNLFIGTIIRLSISLEMYGLWNIGQWNIDYWLLIIDYRVNNVSHSIFNIRRSINIERNNSNISECFFHQFILGPWSLWNE